VSIMFAALLGYNPVKTLLGTTLHNLPASHAAYLTGHSFFPSLISGPFQHGLTVAFTFALVACLVAGLASLLRGKRYVHGVTATSEGTGPTGEQLERVLSGSSAWLAQRGMEVLQEEAS
jgi:hypothetical protein